MSLELSEYVWFYMYLLEYKMTYFSLFTLIV